MSVIKQSINSTQFMADHDNLREMDSKSQASQQEEGNENVSKQVFNDSQSLLLDNEEQQNQDRVKDGCATSQQNDEKSEKQESSEFQQKSRKQQNMLIISEFARQFDADLEQKMKYMAHQVAYYEQKYAKYKNIAARQEDVIIKIIAELKETREALKFHKESIPARLEAQGKTKDLELARLKEEIAEKQKLIKKLEKKLNERTKISQIMIEEIVDPNQNHEKKLQNLLCEQQKLLKQSSQKIQALTDELYQLSISSIQQQSEINNLKCIILNLEHENRSLFQQKQYQMQKNERMKIMMEAEEKKLQELGNYIVQLTTSLCKKKQKKHQIKPQQIGSKSTIRVGE